MSVDLTVRKAKGLIRGRQLAISESTSALSLFCIYGNLNRKPPTAVELLAGRLIRWAGNTLGHDPCIDSLGKPGVLHNAHRFAWKQHRRTGASVTCQ